MEPRFSWLTGADKALLRRIRDAGMPLGTLEELAGQLRRVATARTVWGEAVAQLVRAETLACGLRVALLELDHYLARPGDALQRGERHGRMPVEAARRLADALREELGALGVGSHAAR